ncbi:uncharacterized protein TNCV_1150951 [Trichonephila clavipes]|nr:uncharacterized protein TNCV_1150951 [Trichonephila clavipes]
MRGTTPNGGVDGWASKAAYVMDAMIPNVFQSGLCMVREDTGASSEGTTCAWMVGDEAIGFCIFNFSIYPCEERIYQLVCNISGDRRLTKTIARLRTGHHRGMMFDRDDRRTYRNCDNCLDTELTPTHIFDSPAILAALQEIGVFFSSTNLYVDNIAQSAGTVIWAP